MVSLVTVSRPHLRVAPIISVARLRRGGAILLRGKAFIVLIGDTLNEVCSLVTTEMVDYL